MKAQNIVNSRGNAVANQIVIIGDDRVVTFQSYDSEIARYDRNTRKLYLINSMWDYSNTTRKHFATFLGDWTTFGYGSKKEFLKSISENENIEVI